MSNKTVPVLRLVDRDEARELPELSEELGASLTEIVGMAREGLLAMSVGVGLRVFAEICAGSASATAWPIRRVRRRGCTGPVGTG
ncbi:MAG: hypothetical protein HYX34_02500 [Actinobacteria bacterium]|nr:hypothetical protein [Actinomycetota bacterium]